MIAKTKTAIYCRTIYEDDGALMMQEREVRDFAMKYGYTNISVFKDNGYRGIGTDSPAFSIMDQQINAGKIGVVLVYDIDRIGQNMRSRRKWIKDIKKMGIEFIPVRELLKNQATL